jgi:hypothetical protein
MYPESTIERFWSKVNVGPPDQCWEWQAGLSLPNGYGVFWLNQSNHGAHRVSWTLENGEIPEGLLVLHKCDNKKCVNPRHLYLGTNLQNAQDTAQRNSGYKERIRQRVIKTNKERPAAVARRGNSKLSDQDVLRIRELVASGMMQKDVADMYGISRAAVCRIVRNKSWQELR